MQSLKEKAAAGEVVDITAMAAEIIEDMMYRMVFGRNKDGRVDLKILSRDSINLAGTFNLVDFFPFLEYFDLQVYISQQININLIKLVYFHNFILFVYFMILYYYMHKNLAYSYLFTYQKILYAEKC